MCHIAALDAQVSFRENVLFFQSIYPAALVYVEIIAIIDVYEVSEVVILLDAYFEFSVFYRCAHRGMGVRG
jgi:hypothetical protein